MKRGIAQERETVGTRESLKKSPQTWQSETSRNRVGTAKEGQKQHRVVTAAGTPVKKVGEKNHQWGKERDAVPGAITKRPQIFIKNEKTFLSPILM